MKLFGKLVRPKNVMHEPQSNGGQQSRSNAILTPIIPIRYNPMDSWFGGKPKLPQGASWPVSDGTPLRFACQINLSSLPKNVWAGIGPRAGWLVVFLHPETAAPKILHFHGEGEERDGPGQMSAQWASNCGAYAAKYKVSLLPRWPIKIEEGQLRPLNASSRSINAVWKGVQPDLANPENYPFDHLTLSTLLDSLEEFFISQVKHICRFPAMKKLREHDAVWMQQTKVIAFQSLEEFYKIESLLVNSKYRFDYDAVVSLLPRIANLPTYEDKYLKDDDEGYCVLEYRRSSLNEMPTLSPSLPTWWAKYTSMLYWHSINAYTKAPSNLHSAGLRRMEQIWREEANGCHGAIGHVPEGHIYTLCGPNTDTEVLLELPTSQMQGWAWGDTYSLVLTIKREALSRGDFSTVNYDITN